MTAKLENEKIVYVAGTFDTKHDELNYIAQCLKATGIPVVTANLGTRNAPVTSTTDHSADDIARHHPHGANSVLTLNDRGEAIAAMATAFEYFLASRDDVAGVIGAGGSGGTALLAPALRNLPIGIPKLIVSTVASGNVAPYVGASDLTLMYSVTDVEGLNRISRQVLGNAAHAMAGMISHASFIDSTSARPAIGLTMFGVTTPCVKAVTAQLDDHYDCLVFHATGTGGMSMEKLADSGLIDAILDLTTTEVADMLVGGVFAASNDRMGAVIRSGCPYVGSLGALDMVNFGARNTVPAKFNNRLFHIHNPQVTLMRTMVDENQEIARWIANKLNAMHGDVRFLIPELGVSMLDTEGQPFFDPLADAALFDTLEEELVQTDKRRLIRVPANINDQAFVDAVIKQFTEITTPLG
jgi:uncharacterized protein (UPF0261 family)